VWWENGEDVGMHGCKESDFKSAVVGTIIWTVSFPLRFLEARFTALILI
jgi:hypothetical protein